jgi:ABC-2 type transport system permease protein
VSSVAATVRQGLRGAAAGTRINLLVAAQYRANMAVWSVASLLQIVVYLSVWRAVAEASGGSTAGYTASEFAGYFLVLTVVRELTMTWMPYELQGCVRNGTLTPLLLRPLHPIIEIASGMLAFRLQSMALVVPTAVLLFFAFDATIHSSATALVAVALVLPLASLTRFLSDTLLGLCALWLVRIDGIRGMYYLLLLLLGGQFAPIAVLPDTLQLVAKALPFYWTLGYPTDLVVGTASTSDAWIGILVLTVWSTLLWSAFRVVWRRGLRSYEAVGS